MGEKSILALVAAFLFINASFCQTKEEMTASDYCIACIDDLTLLERQGENLKAQVEARGVTVEALKGIILNTELIAEYWEAKANERPKFSDLGFFQKLWVYFKGVIIGGIITVIGLAAI